MSISNSEQEMRELLNYGAQIINNPEILNSKFKTIDVIDDNIDFLVPGTYRLANKPSVSLLKKLPHYKNSSSEVGIICFNSNWYIILSDENEFEVPLPIEFKILKHLGVLQFHLHSHPAKFKEYAHLPSDIDLGFCNGSTDQCQYIVSEKGLTQIRNKFPRSVDLEDLWSAWIINDLKLTKDKFMEIGFPLLMTDFCNIKLNYKLIGWENEKEIEDIIASKGSLTSESDFKK
jgi:hypothetical protein